MPIENLVCPTKFFALHVTDRFEDRPGDAEVAADRFEVQQRLRERAVHVEENGPWAWKMRNLRHVPTIADAAKILPLSDVLKTSFSVKDDSLQAGDFAAILALVDWADVCRSIEPGCVIRMSLDVQKIFEVSDPAAVVKRAVDLLDDGELVVIPTETVYGAAARLDRPKAVEQFRKLRSNASGPFTIHVSSAQRVRELVGPLSDLGLRMTQKLWPGPVSLVFDVPADLRKSTAKRLGLTEADLYSDGTMTLRCPDHAIATEILEGVDGPVAVTRVDPPSETSQSQISDHVSMAIDAGRTRYSKPSTIVRIEGERYRVVRDGVYDARIIDKQLKTLVLFVCSGNTCRSPMASALATKLIRDTYHLGNAETETAGISIQSAGTFAMPGLRATPQAVEAMTLKGADLTSHRSRQLTPELIHAADFIFTMGRSHSQAVLAMAPSAASRVMAINPNGDIEDPIGGDLSLYQEVAGKFERLIQERFEQTLFKLHPPEERS